MIRAIFILLTLFPIAGFGQPLATQLVEAAMARTHQQVSYNGAYFSIAYPNGDVPQHLGVCTDVVIRSYRTLGIDLQKEVHEDMLAHFNQYPSKRIWGLSHTDKNIDHRRVPNLQVYFSRHGERLANSSKKEDYHAGELVTWNLPGNLPHIGIVSDQRNLLTGNPLIIHNIGSGPEISDMLFAYKITGHYRFMPENNY